MAHEKGVTQEELIEFLDVAITMQGCPGEEWALKAFAAFKQCANGQASPETVCCTH
ncbi:carboxymuconolactone decarboxylase family protein [Nitrospira sp. Nam80]